MIWKLMCLLMLLVPLALLALGLIGRKCPPQGPNWTLGYRSRRARASDEAWLFAQAYVGRIWFWMGSVLLVVALILGLILRGRSMETICRAAAICIGVQDLCVLGAVISTEAALNRRYDRYGDPRVSTQGQLNSAPSGSVQPEAAYIEQLEDLEI